MNGTGRSSASSGNHAVRSTSCLHRGSGTRRRVSRASSSSSAAAFTCARSGSANCSRRRASAWRLTCITHPLSAAPLDASSAKHVTYLGSDRASNMHKWAGKVQLYDDPPL